MRVYQTDHLGFLIGPTEADPDPMREGEFLFPGGCVGAVPPALGANEAAQYVNGAWTVVPNFLGTVYWLPSGQKGEVTELGKALPAGAVTTDPGPSLQKAQGDKLIELYTAYSGAIQATLPFTSAGGVTQTFQADSFAQDALQKSSQGYNKRGAVPVGFYWVAFDDSQVPFTLTDLNGLYDAMLDRGWASFQNLQDKKALVNAPTATVASVQAITW